MPLIPIDLDAETNASQGVSKLDNGVFVTDEGYYYFIDHTKKKFSIWLIGEIFGGPTRYLKLISMLEALTEEYSGGFNIHSPGGCIVTTGYIIGAIERCKADLTMVNIGLAASCGSLILAVGKKIYVAPNAITMFHSAGLGLMDLVHRAATQINHIQSYVEHLFTMMKKKGLLTDQEHEAIIKRGEEFYLTSDVMTERLKANNLWNGEI